MALGALVLAAPAWAQDPPLTTLLGPHDLTTTVPLSTTAPLSRTDRFTGSTPLFGDDPLANVDALTGEGSLSNPRPARPRAGADPAKPTGCEQGRESAGAAALPPGVAYGGSGPGEYARFLPNDGAAEVKPAPATPPTTAGLPGDRPLYAGVDRPLWGATPPARRSAREPSRGASRDPAPDTRAAERRRDPAAPPPGVDRPLWPEAQTERAGAEPCRDTPAPARFGAEPPR